MTPSSTSSSRWVASTPPRGIVLGHNPSCKPAMTTRSHSCPSAACALSTLTCCAPSAGSAVTPGQLQRRDVLDESAQRRTGRARHVLIGDVEQRGHRVEVPGGLGAARAAALAGRQPAPLQTGPLPRRPQRVARILAVAIAAGSRVQHRAHPPQRRTARRTAARRRTAPRPAGHRICPARHRAWRAAAFGAAGAARPGRRDRWARSATASARAPSSPSAVAARHREQRPRRGFLGQRAAERGRGHRDPGGGQRARQPRAGPRHRPDDHRHLRPRHPVDQVGTPQRVGDHRRLGVRRGGQAHGDRSVLRSRRRRCACRRCRRATGARCR